jgi:hypothetical protein
VRVVDFDNQRLTVYVPDGWLDLLAIRRIAGIEAGHIPILGAEQIYFRRWDYERPGPPEDTTGPRYIVAPSRPLK